MSHPLDALPPRARDALLAASWFCDHLVPHPALSPAANRTGRRLDRYVSAALARRATAPGSEFARLCRLVARRIADVREREPIKTSRDLARVVIAAVPRQKPPQRIHPATRTFQALRIAVNQELKSLRIALERVPPRLSPGGRMAVISFHSLEDRLVKEAFRNRQVWDNLTTSPIEASVEEESRNPRSRSAKLRAAQLAATPAPDGK